MMHKLSGNKIEKITVIKESKAGASFDGFRKPQFESSSTPKPAPPKEKK
jgi:hypothetical protein